MFLPVVQQSIFQTCSPDSSVPNSDQILSEVFSFLSNYAWIYKYRWIVEKSPSVHPWLECLPSSWERALSTIAFEDLQKLVSGRLDAATIAWPSDLLQFASSCRRYTQLLSHDCALRSDLGTWNPDASCVDFVTWSLPKHCVNQKRINPKKSHELQKMTAFLDHIIDRSSPIQSRAISPVGENVTGSFQTSPLMTETGGVDKTTVNNVRTSSSVPSLNVVDVGSGLGHLLNAVIHSPPNNERSARLVVGVECDSALHDKAENQIATEDHKDLKRILFRLEPNNISALQSKLHEIFDDYERVNKVRIHPRSDMMLTSNYLLSGLHCCGDLSWSVIKLFLTDPAARFLVLVGCCYHRMNLEQFPISRTLQRKATGGFRNFFTDTFNTVATFRLACQWSPSQWLSWTREQFEVHRIVYLRRILICQLSLSSSNSGRFNPEQIPSLSESLISKNDHQLDFSDVMPCLLEHLNVTTTDFLDISKLNRLWILTPGLLALQQLLQPLLEIFILSDRLYWIREAGQSAGYLRLFDPGISPRCMALFVQKEFSGVV